MASIIEELINRGEFFFNVEGFSPEEIYKQVVENLDLPVNIDKNTLLEALVVREKMMSTAIGNGIALPHSRTPLAKNVLDQRIDVVYLKNPINMKAPDGINVHVMFILITENPTTHLQVLSELAEIFKHVSFRKLLEQKAEKEEILEAIKKINEENE